MNEQIIISLRWLLQFLQDKKERCLDLKNKTSKELLEIGLDHSDIDRMIELHTREIAELEQDIISIKL